MKPSSKGNVSEKKTIGVDEATSAEPGHEHDAHDLPLRIFRLVPVP